MFCKRAYSAGACDAPLVKGGGAGGRWRRKFFAEGRASRNFETIPIPDLGGAHFGGGARDCGLAKIFVANMIDRLQGISMPKCSAFSATGFEQICARRRAGVENYIKSPHRANMPKTVRSKCPAGVGYRYYNILSINSRKSAYFTFESLNSS